MVLPVPSTVDVPVVTNKEFGTKVVSIGAGPAVSAGAAASVVATPKTELLVVEYTSPPFTEKRLLFPAATSTLWAAFSQKVVGFTVVPTVEYKSPWSVRKTCVTWKLAVVTPKLVIV